MSVTGSPSSAAILTVDINTASAEAKLTTLEQRLGKLGVSTTSNQEPAQIQSLKTRIAELEKQLTTTTAASEKLKASMSGLGQTKTQLTGINQVVNTWAHKLDESGKAMTRVHSATGRVIPVMERVRKEVELTTNTWRVHLRTAEMAGNAGLNAQKNSAREQASMLQGMLNMRKSYDSYMTGRGSAFVAVNRRELDAQKASAREQADMLKGMMNMRKSYDSYMTGRGNEIVAILRRTTDGTKRLAGATGNAGWETKGFTNAQNALHSALRGVGGTMGALWLTYGKFVSVMIAAGAATKAVKDSIGGGLETTFQSQFVATIDTKGLTQGTALQEQSRAILTGLRDVARDSVFTVQENAEALRKLSLAGIEASRGIGLLETASNAAIFAQKGLGEVTGMVLDTLYNFNLASTDAGVMADNFTRVADVMSYTAITVNAGFDDIAKSFQNVVGVAGSFNIEIEEASYLLQNLAQAGIRGQKAGTYVRNFLDDLLGAPISNRAEGKFEELGIERFNPSTTDQYAVSKYIDGVISKVKDLGFVEQQDFLRAVSNQRSRRVWRQELLASYDKEATMLRRVSELAGKAEGSLAKMAEGLKDTGKYSLQMAQAAYDAAAIGAFQSIGADASFAAIGKQLQGVFNSNEFAQFLEASVKFATDALKVFADLFGYLVQNGPVITDILAAAFDVAKIALFTLAVTKLVKVAGLALTAMKGLAVPAAVIASWTSMTAAAKAAGLAMGVLSAGAFMGPPRPSAPSRPAARMSPANALVGLGASATVLGAGIMLIASSENAKLDHAGKSLRQINEELAEIQRRRQQAVASNDYTGFAEFQTSKYDEQIKSLLTAQRLQRQIESTALGESRAKSFLQTHIEEVEDLKETYNAAQQVIAAGLVSPEQANSLLVGVTDGFVQTVDTLGERISVRLKSIAAETQEIIKVPLDLRTDSQLGRLTELQAQAASLNKTLADLGNLQDDALTFYEQKIQDSIFVNLSKEARALKLNVKEGVDGASEELSKAFSEAFTTDGMEAATFLRVVGGAYDTLTDSAWGFVNAAQEAGDSNLVKFHMDQANAAFAAADSYEALTAAQRRSLEMSEFMAGKGVLSTDTVASIDTSQLSDFNAAMERTQALVQMTKREMFELTIAAAAVDMKAAFESGDTARGQELLKFITLLTNQFYEIPEAVLAAKNALDQLPAALSAYTTEFIKAQEGVAGITSELTTAQAFVIEVYKQFGDALNSADAALRADAQAKLEAGVAAANFADQMKKLREEMPDKASLLSTAEGYRQQYLEATKGADALRAYTYSMELAAVAAIRANAALLNTNSALETTTDDQALAMRTLAAELEERANILATGIALNYSTPPKPARGGGRSQATNEVRDVRKAAEAEYAQWMESINFSKKIVELRKNSTRINEQEYQDALDALAAKSIELGVQREKKVQDEIRRQLGTARDESTKSRLNSLMEESVAKEAQLKMTAVYELEFINERKLEDVYKLTKEYKGVLEDIAKQHRRARDELFENRAVEIENDFVRRAGAQAVLDVTRAYRDELEKVDRLIRDTASTPSIQAVHVQHREELVVQRGVDQDKARADAQYWAETRRSFNEGWDTAFRKFNDDATDYAAKAQSAFDTMSKGMHDGFENFFMNPTKEGFKGLLLSFVDMLRKMASQALAARLTEAIFGSPGSQSGVSTFLKGLASIASGVSGGGNFAPVLERSFTPFARGGSFDMSNVTPFARGGAFGKGEILTSPTFFKFANGGQFRDGVAGEAGPEAALPLKRMANGKLGVEFEGGGAPQAQNLRIINVLDSGLVGDFLSTPEGETAILNVVRRNSNVLRGLAA